MSWRDLLNPRTVGDHGLICRAPTVRTVLLLLDRAEKEIQALRVAVGQGVEPLIAARRLVGLNPALAAHLLATCVEVQGTPKELTAQVLRGSPELCAEALLLVLSLCDAPRMARGMGLVPIEPGEGEPAAPVIPGSNADMAEAAIVAVAYAFSVPPHDVMDWPYEEFHASMDVLAKMGVLNTGAATQAAPWLTAENAPEGVLVS